MTQRIAPLEIRRAPPPVSPPPTADNVVSLADAVSVDRNNDLARVELPDGSVSINLRPVLPKGPPDSNEHDANLATSIQIDRLASIADELLRLIDEDLMRQDKRLADIAKGIELLGVKLDEPRVEPTEEGMSVVRHPLLLEAVLRTQANARGEFLPADGPVKMRDDDMTNSTAEEIAANKLARDFNHYLTTIDAGYYPDTDRMIFEWAFGGEAYKKVYRDPLRNRPISRRIPRQDLILSDGGVCLEENPRVTHRIRMAPSSVRRMQLSGAWADISLGSYAFTASNAVDKTIESVSGVSERRSMDPKEQDRTIYECYCELDIPGFEHMEKGEPTGLSLPYRVTIDKDAREVLEVRRWWREGDKACLRKQMFIEFVYVPALAGLNLGLLHILGNGGRALTAAWRIALDNGMLANFPGGLAARSTGRQQTTNIRVSPGTAAPIDTEGQPIGQVFAPLPYRDVTPGFVSVVQNIEQTCQRVGGMADTAVGEGRQDAPVGTTLALIEQAKEVMSGAHKRFHQAQQKEFMLLKELFAEDPESLYRHDTDDPNMPMAADEMQTTLANNYLVPAADPNTSSQTMRIQKAVAIKMLASQNPQLYDMAAVDRRVMMMMGVSDIDSLFAKGQPPQQRDPAKEMDAQAKLMTAQAKLLDTHEKWASGEADAVNRAAERESKERIELLRLAQRQVTHPESANIAGDPYNPND